MLRADHIARIASDVKMNLKQGVIVLVISSGPRARPVLKLLARLLPEMYSTRSNYYYLLSNYNEYRPLPMINLLTTADGK